MQMVTGQKIKFAELGINDINQTFTLVVELIMSHAVIDVACFGLDTGQQLVSDDYMVFYNQPQTPCSAVSLQEINSQHRFDINLNKLSANIDYLVLTATIDGQQTMRQLEHGKVWLEQAGQTIAEYGFDGNTFDNERAVMLLQVYRKSDVWRINAIGQGFNGGLSALVTHFGGEVADDTPATPQLSSHSQHQSQTIQPSLSTSTTPPSLSSSLNLTKVTLDKPGSEHRINLTKGSVDKLIVEAIWVDNGDSSADNDDLDLRVGILPQQAKEMIYIHAPQQVGSFSTMPYVYHHGDVQVASIDEPGKETVTVNPAIAQHYGGKVALVFSVYSAIGNGVVSIASLQPKMRMQYRDQVVECVFNIKASPKAKSRFVYTYVIGIAIIDEHGITLQHSGETSKRMSEATPRLIWHGDKVEMKIDGKSMFKTPV
ncbi:TerD family protein [Psychrobacter sp. I-STPA10]|uniref:TerD family protein n=1 Tax=Psychrobacter sp. I-STPA10 TaxID=2585769 RepID=UPI001E373C71|nr:TerD family protein [Psychrobacter sp. I-STPA10]